MKMAIWNITTHFVVEGHICQEILRCTFTFSIIPWHVNIEWGKALPYRPYPKRPT